MRMDRRTFIKTGTLAAAATTLGGCRSCNTAPGPSPSAAGANTFAVEVHGGFAHILRRRGGKAESLLFGPTRAAYGHPHGMRLRIRKGEVNEPAKNVPYAEIMIEQTPWFVWDLLGWDIAVLPDGNVPSGEMKLPNNPALTDPRPDANWNSIAHIPDQ